MSRSNRMSRWIMGSAIGTAAIAVAIDHTRHRLPEPAPAVTQQPADQEAAVVIIVEDSESPCGLDASPCSLDDSPYSIEESPCAFDESPCSL